MRSPPKPPDLTPLSNAQIELGRQANELAREQLGLSREQFDFFRATSLEELGFAREQATQMLGLQREALDISRRGAASMEGLSDAQRALMEQARDYGARDRARWESTFIPLQDRFIADAQAYDTPERREMEAGRAVGEIQLQADAQRRQADARLSSMGLDPSQFRSGTIAATLGAQTAASGAQAANNTRRAVEDKGRALIADSIGLGMGLPAQATTSIGVASGAGANAAGAAGGAASTGMGGISTSAALGSGAAGLRQGALNSMGSLTGSPMQWAQLGTGSMGMAGNQYNNAGSMLTQGFSNQMASTQARNQFLGGIAGTALGFFNGGGAVKRDKMVIDLPRDDYEFVPPERMDMGIPERVGPTMGERIAGVGRGLSKMVGATPMDRPDFRAPRTMRDRIGGLSTGLSSMADAEPVQVERILKPIQMAEGGSTRRRGTVIPRKQTRDTVPAMLTEGEYVIPADVVEALGINHFDKLVAKFHRPGA